MITERDLLDEIGRIVSQGHAFASREKARNFFDPLELPSKLESYIKESRRDSLSNAAQMFGMSVQTLKGILGRKHLSENMLFRLRNTLEYAIQHPGISVSRDEGDTYFGNWKKTNTKETQRAISEVAERLIVLKKVIKGSNSLNASTSPIDEIQVAQLVALLEATLAAIKAPLVDVESTAGFFKWLRKFGKRGAEKGIENSVSEAIGSAVKAGFRLLTRLSKIPGLSDLDGIVD